MMSVGPWQSRAGSTPPPAPGIPGTGAEDDQPGQEAREPGAGDPGYASPAAEPDYGIDGIDVIDAIDEQAPGRRGVAWWTADGRRLAAAAGALALTSALAGGALGGYIATRAADQGTSPGYSLGPVPAAAAQRPAGSVAAVAARVLPSVVTIRVNGGAGTGSGFVVRGGYIVTDNHVVTLDGTARSTKLQVVLASGRTEPAQLIGRDTFSDIAVLRPQGTTALRPLPLGNSSGLAVGDPVIAFGAPLGLAGTVTSGIVSALDRPVQPGAGNGPAAPQVYLEAIQTDAPINPGNSGGPLVNRQGQVIGVNAAFDTLGGNMITGQGGSIGLGFAIPINEARRVAGEIVRTGHASHAVLGAELNLRYAGSGAQIAGAPGVGPPVAAGGPAARAGLHAGDVIVGFGGQQVTSAQMLLDAIRAEPPGARVRITFLQGGQSRQVTLRLGSAGS